MRADARKNYDHLLSVAREAITEHGADASLRHIARRANVGLATLYRHFPTRDALLETLLRENLDRLTERAGMLERSITPDKALIAWFRDGLAFTQTFNGVVALMAAALEDVDSALHVSCSQVRAAGARLLERAQAEGMAPTGIDATDLCALMGALAWIGEQKVFASRADHLCELIIDGILGNRDARDKSLAAPETPLSERTGAARLAQLEEENRNLKLLVADLSLEKRALSDALGPNAPPQAQRAA